ncbi:hypothetical protein [Stutzerimonas urumqiensis]|uniref:hypothetical protein n=1 Tax=Stutzerimonas urumqiensis TaxID=638269 RepID=UPI000EAFA05B|nr:hypothetical protein [Stutzerimonas urumqiensis]
MIKPPQVSAGVTSEGLEMATLWVLGLMVIGWLCVALAMLWGLLRIMRHHRPGLSRDVTASSRAQPSQRSEDSLVSLNA